MVYQMDGLIAIIASSARKQLGKSTISCLRIINGVPKNKKKHGINHIVGKPFQRGYTSIIQGGQVEEAGAFIPCYYIGFVLVPIVMLIAIRCLAVVVLQKISRFRI